MPIEKKHHTEVKVSALIRYAAPHLFLTHWQTKTEVRTAVLQPLFQQK